MSSGTLPQLVEGQPARLDIGESIPCRIIGFTGPDVVLHLEEQPAEPPEQGQGAYLLIEAGGRMQAVRGSIGQPAGEEIVLRLSDDIRLGQRRTFSRAPIALPARVRLRGGGDEWTTTTRDVSAGGVCVGGESPGGRFPWGDVPGGHPPDLGAAFEVRIQVADHEVVAAATAVRITSHDLGLRFEEIELDDRMLLASLALAYHRRR
jgi:hypothetical protein